MKKNGYFIVSTKSDGTYIEIFEPENDGKPVTTDEITGFLDMKSLYYNMSEINDNLKNKNKKSFKISDIEIGSSAAFCDYKVSEDKMNVTAVLYPRVGDATDMSVDELENDLNVRGIKYGIKHDVIKELVEEKVYNTPVVIVSGDAPVQGHDAKIEYLFNTSKLPKPKVNEDGSVDFHRLDIISHVSKNQTVAQLIPEDKGKPGHDVFGNEIQPARVNKKNFKYGNNLHISEDGLRLISKVNGQVTLENDKVFVSNVYEVPVDLDVTTGDIDFDGDVVVKGNVRSGFSLKATGNVTVVGVVEGAYINAGGDVTINRGIQGMNKAEIRAGGSVVAKFIENATIVAGGNIETDTLLHSSVSAGGGVNAQGKNGLIVGGTVRSAKNVVAKQIGNEMETVTNVYVGVDPMLRKRINELGVIIKKQNQDKEKLNQVIAVLRKKMETDGKLETDKQEMLQKSMKNIILLEQSIKKDTLEYQKGQEKLVEDCDVRIKISRSIYPGTKLSFGNTIFYIKSRNDYCQYAKQGADVVRLPL